MMTDERRESLRRATLDKLKAQQWQVAIDAIARIGPRALGEWTHTRVSLPTGDTPEPARAEATRD